MRGDGQPDASMSVAQRIRADLGAIACWLTLWGIAVALGMKLGKWAMDDPQGRDPGYMIFVVFVGFAFISPVGFA